MSPSVESDRFPYIGLHVEVRGQLQDIEALIDTGFDGFLAVPPALLDAAQPPDDYQSWSMADGTRVVAPLYLGTVQVGDLAVVPALITALGHEPLVGRGVTDRFRLTLDHGERVLVDE
jgi:predicted aspartyl protease